jgi:hypothetical protein
VTLRGGWRGRRVKRCAHLFSATVRHISTRTTASRAAHAQRVPLRAPRATLRRANALNHRSTVTSTAGLPAPHGANSLTAIGAQSPHE